MINLKNVSNQTLEVYVKDEPVRILPRKRFCVERVTVQMKNLLIKKMLKKVK